MLVRCRRGPEAATEYLFFTKHLPAACKLYLAEGRPNFLPKVFLQRLWLGDSRLTQEPQGLKLAAWEYYLFCFCMWPIQNAGENALTDAFMVASSSTISVCKCPSSHFVCGCPLECSVTFVRP